MQETQEMWVRSLGWEDPMQKEMATHSNILAWRIPWTEELGGPQFMESQRVGYDWACTRMHTHTHASGFGRDAWEQRTWERGGVRRKLIKSPWWLEFNVTEEVKVGGVEGGVRRQRGTLRVTSSERWETTPHCHQVPANGCPEMEWSLILQPSWPAMGMCKRSIPRQPAKPVAKKLGGYSTHGDEKGKETYGPGISRVCWRIYVFTVLHTAQHWLSIHVDHQLISYYISTLGYRSHVYPCFQMGKQRYKGLV